MEKVILYCGEKRDFGHIGNVRMNGVRSTLECCAVRCRRVPSVILQADDDDDDDDDSNSDNHILVYPAKNDRSNLCALYISRNPASPVELDTRVG
jgi:hypothetical protein